MGSTWRDRELPERERSGEPLPPEREPAPGVAQLLALQQGAGNAAVARMLAREAAPSSSSADVTAGELGAMLAELQGKLGEA